MFSEILSQFLNHLVPYHFRGDSIVLQELADLVMRDIPVIHPASELIGECDVIRPDEFHIRISLENLDFLWREEYIISFRIAFSGFSAHKNGPCRRTSALSECCPFYRDHFSAVPFNMHLI